MASAFRKTGVAVESLTPEYRAAPERSEWQEEAADLTVKGGSPIGLPSIGIPSSAKGDQTSAASASGAQKSPSPVAGDASVSGGVALRLRDVAKRFGDKQVLSELSLAIEPGAIVAIVGRSGCGKSTLLRLLTGLDTASEGELTRAGEPVRDIDADTRFMFQDARLLPWQTVIDNVKIGLAGVPSAEADRRAREALELVGLADRAGDWPSVLSGGQRQRVALARALVGQPHLLLFDEPLGALDALTRIEMQQLIESLWTSRGFTAVLVTHDVSEAVALADRVILIEAGRIALDIPITLARPRVKDSGFAHFEQLILSRVLQTDGGAERSRERSDFDI